MLRSIDSGDAGERLGNLSLAACARIWQVPRDSAPASLAVLRTLGSKSRWVAEAVGSLSWVRGISHPPARISLSSGFAAAARIAPGEVSAGTYLTQTDRFKGCRFIMNLPGLKDGVMSSGSVLPALGAVGRLVLHRSPYAVWLESAGMHLLETLAPHLKRAAAVQEALSRAEAATESLGAADAAAGIAVFLLAKDCRVLHANAKAEAIMRREIGLRYEHGRLAAATPRSPLL